MYKETVSVAVWQGKLVTEFREEDVCVCVYVCIYVCIYVCMCVYVCVYVCITWSGNKVRELIAVKVLHTSLLNTTVVAFKVLPLRSYAPIPAPSPPFKTLPAK